MTVADMTPDMLRAGALKCPIKLPGGKGPKTVDAATGDWFAYPAKTEVTKRYRKACIDDLRNRQLRGGSYAGDVGHCVIGGKRFSLYPKSGFLVRDDFAQWCEANFDSFWDAVNHRDRLPKAPQGREVTVEEHLKMFKEIRKRALELKAPTGLMAEGQFNTLYDMKHTLAEYVLAMRSEEKRGEYFISTKILADQLAATIAFREANYHDAKSFFLDCAASAMRSALWIQEQFSPKEVANG